MGEMQAVIYRVEENPDHPGVHEAWFVCADAAFHVWALIGHYLAVGRDVHRLAQDFDLPGEAAEAIVREYEGNDHVRHAIDARLEPNEKLLGS